MAKIKVTGAGKTNFNCTEFEGIKNVAGLNRFFLSVKQWIEKINSIGIVTKAGHYSNISVQTRNEKSRRDGTLLTVEFILRTIGAMNSLLVPKGRHIKVRLVSSLRDFGGMLFHQLRRLKPTVNRVSSLRDYLPQLNKIAIQQMNILQEVESRKLLK